MILTVYRNVDDEVLKKLCRRPRFKTGTTQTTACLKLEAVQAMLESVERQGEAGIRELRSRFDKIDGPLVSVKAEELKEQASHCPVPVQEAIKVAINNIKKFHTAQKPEVKKTETVKGINCWRKAIPIESVGLYIPGGLAPLFSSLIMLAVPAIVSGCKRILVCTPPTKEKIIDSSIAFVANELGLGEVFLIGGTQAVALMAYGGDQIDPVDKIFGPGNQYVTLAKQILAGKGVAIDMPAGPSEVLIIADNSAKPDYIAADILSQCEHGPDSQAVLLCNSSQMIEQVNQELQIMLKKLNRQESLVSSLENSFAVCIDDLSQAVKLSDTYAPEHLILATKNAAQLAETVSNAGSIFIGNYSAEVFGDYASGPNHTLPTAGYARAYSGVSCDSFCKFVTFQEVSLEGAALLSSTVQTLANAEGLDAHALAASLRTESSKT